MSKEVIFYIPSLGAGGAERQCAYFAATLQQKCDCKCSIIITRKSVASTENIHRVEQAGVPVHEFPWFNPLGLLRLYVYFIKHRRSTLFCYQTFPNFFGCILAKFAGLWNCYGGVRVSWLPTRFMIMEYIVHYLFSRKTIFNSFRGRDSFENIGFVSRKCLVVSNAIESARFVKDYGNRKEGVAVRVITVGRFKPSKDYRTLIKTIRKVIDDGVKINSVIVGYGQLEEQIKSWIQEMNLEGTVSILPGHNGVDIQEELAKSDIYLSTSLFEGTSNSIMEALNAGLPVVATDAGDNNYLIQDGESGYICPVGDYEALAEKVKFLAGNYEIRKRFGISARERMSNNHSVDAIVSQYLPLIERNV